jgi:hypothetical protein
MKTQFKKKMAVLANCPLCFYNKENVKELMIAESDSAYITYPANKLIVEDECWILSKEHTLAMNAIEEHVYEEIRKYMTSLTTYYSTKKKATIFIELVIDYNNADHTVTYLYNIVH